MYPYKIYKVREGQLLIRNLNTLKGDKSKSLQIVPEVTLM